MKKIISIFLALISTLSCQDNNVKNSNAPNNLDKNTLDSIQTIENSRTIISQNVTTDNNEIEKKVIKFDHFDIIINDYRAYNYPILIKNDTLNISEEPGYNFENKILEIRPKNHTDKFELYIALENNLTVYLGEKQFIDLEKWKSINKYERLEDSSKYYFRTIFYNGKSTKQRRVKDFDKIKSEVLKLEGEYISEEVKTVTTLDALPIEFWISRVFLKIIRIDENGEKEQIILINNSSWGC